tara:strand:- start:190 stop:471 length:282 start_codon:yes stop_codon:yes gene_type:complete
MGITKTYETIRRYKGLCDGSRDINEMISNVKSEMELLEQLSAKGVTLAYEADNDYIHLCTNSIEVVKEYHDFGWFEYDEEEGRIYLGEDGLPE